jgi:hypothetical protein
MPPIRPSALTLAERCELAPALAAEFPHTNEAIERGNLVDSQVTEEIRGGAIAEDPDSRAIVQWVKEHMGEGTVRVQEKVSLYDPDTGELLTEGTPDLAGTDLFQLGTLIVDMKKREQWYAANLPPPDESLQLLAYGLAVMLTQGTPEFQACALLFGDGEVEPLWSRTYTVVEARPILNRIRAIAARERARGDTRPLGVSGPHCTACFQRKRCRHWLPPEGATTLAPYAAAGITRANAQKAYLLYKQLDDAKTILRSMLEDHVAAEGPIPVGEDKQWGPITWPARESVDLRALKADGLDKYIRRGQPSVQWRITRKR